MNGNCCECGEPLYDALNTFGTADEPLCVVCQSAHDLREMRRRGFTHEEITALHRVWVRHTDQRYAEMRRQEGR